MHLLMKKSRPLIIRYLCAYIKRDLAGLSSLVLWAWWNCWWLWCSTQCHTPVLPAASFMLSSTVAKILRRGDMVMVFYHPSGFSSPTDTVLLLSPSQQRPPVSFTFIYHFRLLRSGHHNDCMTQGPPKRHWPILRSSEKKKKRFPVVLP